MNTENIELKDLLPKEIIREKFLGEYEECCDLIWKEMVLINSSLTALEKFSNLPDCFLDPSETDFFEIIKVSLRESILLVHCAINQFPYIVNGSPVYVHRNGLASLL